MSGNSDPKFSVGQKVKHMDTGITVTIKEVVTTSRRFYYDIVGWEGTSWGHTSEDELMEIITEND